MTERRAEILAALSGLVFAASTPPIDFQPGILIGLVGYAYALAICGSDQKRRYALLGFLFGFFSNLEALRFVPGVMQRFTDLPAIAGIVALVLLAAGQAVPWVLGALGFRWLKRHGVPGFLAFAVGIYVATFVPALFPWTPAGGLSRWPILIQTAEVVGERGTSFVIAIACALIAERKVRQVAIAAGLFTVLLAYGALRMREIDRLRSEAVHARVGLLQPDFEAAMRWDAHHAIDLLDRMTTLTRRAEAEGSTLTIWPESAYPYTLAHGTKTSPRGGRAVLQDGVKGPVLTGAHLTKGGGLGTNSAILVEPGGDIGPSYDKRHLLWFGESVPLADMFPIMRQIFARGTGLEPGTESIAFKSGPIVASVLNCYEDTLPAAGREAMATTPPPNLLVNITNDAWFVGSAEGELHLRLAVLRAIEARRDLVRSVNRGPTSWVDANGRVLARRDPDLTTDRTTHVLPPPLVVDAALLSTPLTLYTRAGDLPLILLVVIALVGPKAQRARSLLRPRGSAPAA